MPKKKQIVTSLRIDSELWKEAKVQAIRDDMTLRELVEKALKEWIRKNGKTKRMPAKNDGT